MATLTLTGVGASHGPRTLFTGLDLIVTTGDTWGLLGANGAGKSTLLRLIAATVATARSSHIADRGASADSGDGADDRTDVSLPETCETTGTITVNPPGASVGYLAQETHAMSGETIGDYIRRRTGVAAAARALDDMAHRYATSDVGDAYAEALANWLDLGGADFEERYGRLARRLGLDLAATTPMEGLSGGQRARVNLAVLLLAEHDILLLDEPTNDLDADGLAILEEFVAREKRPLLIVSHDREFLARVTTGIVELDLAQQNIAVYRGGYEAYLVERQRARAHAREAYDEYADTMDGLKRRLTTQQNWLDKGTKNAVRKAPDGDKIRRHAAGARTEKQAAKMTQTRRAMDRVEEVVEPRKEWQLQLSIAEGTRSGDIVSTLVDYTCTRGGFTLGPVTCQITRGDRVLISGPNGAGKSTLLRALVDPAHLGVGVTIGSIDQTRRDFLGDASIEEVITRAVPDITGADLRTLVAKFHLTGDRVTCPARELSPGERTRAGLAVLQARGVNLLVLDEPTNHLDVPAIEQLEQAVDSFGGTVLLVTHDRRMSRAFRATRQLCLHGGVVTEGEPRGDGLT